MPGEHRYWVFVCNPKKWHIDRFLGQRIEHDSWGVRKSDKQYFAPGQLGIIRVGVDQRNKTERNNKPRMDPGIYALCEVESEAYPSTGAKDAFWAPGLARKPGWPTVNIRYLKVYQDKPLTIERLRKEAPEVSHLLRNGLQAASFPIPAKDFQKVMSLLGEDIEDLPIATVTPVEKAEDVGLAEEKNLNACPEVKQKVSKSIERGVIGAKLKEALGYKCQICAAIGQNPTGFLKKNGNPYVEAHHVMPVSKLQVGSLAASNIMILCANHHRQLHYGGIEVAINALTFEFVIDGVAITIQKSALK